MIEAKIHGRIEVTGIRGRIRKQLVNDLKEKRGYWRLQNEALALYGQLTLEEAIDLS